MTPLLSVVSDSYQTYHIEGESKQVDQETIKKFENNYNKFCLCVNHFKRLKDEESLLVIIRLMSFSSDSLPKEIKEYILDLDSNRIEKYLDEYQYFIGKVVEKNESLDDFLSKKMQELLPPEIMQRIFSYIPINQIDSLFLTCKSWKIQAKSSLIDCNSEAKIFKTNHLFRNEKDISNYAKVLAQANKYIGAIQLLQKRGIISANTDKKNFLYTKNKNEISNELLKWAFDNKCFSMAFYVFSVVRHFDKIDEHFPKLVELFLIEPEKNLDCIECCFNREVLSVLSRYSSDSVEKIQESLDIFLSSRLISCKIKSKFLFLAFKYNLKLKSNFDNPKNSFLYFQSDQKSFDKYIRNKINILISTNLDFDYVFKIIQKLPSNLLKSSLLCLFASQDPMHIPYHLKINNLRNCLSIIQAFDLNGIEGDEVENIKMNVFNRIQKLGLDHYSNLVFALKKRYIGVEFLVDMLIEKEEWTKANILAKSFPHYQEKIETAECISWSLATMAFNKNLVIAQQLREAEEKKIKDLLGDFEDYFMYSSDDEMNASEEELSDESINSGETSGSDGEDKA